MLIKGSWGSEFEEFKGVAGVQGEEPGVRIQESGG
jgi:hypothetical protein